MKPIYLLLITASLIALPACEQKQSSTEKAAEAIDDALDRRPGEKVLDAAEDAKSAVEEAAEDTKEAVEDASDEVKDAVKEATK